MLTQKTHDLKISTQHLSTQVVSYLLHSSKPQCQHLGLDLIKAVSSQVVVKVLETMVPALFHSLTMQMRLPLTTSSRLNFRNPRLKLITSWLTLKVFPVSTRQTHSNLSRTHMNQRLNRFLQEEHLTTYYRSPLTC